MGTGTDVAMESAGVALLKGDLMGIVRARRLSQATMRNIRENLFLSFAYDVAGNDRPVLSPAGGSFRADRRRGRLRLSFPNARRFNSDRQDMGCRVS